ncbi:MAG: MtnX-like HAD-IB family phosphatase [Thermoleophilia bacterium]
MAGLVLVLDYDGTVAEDDMLDRVANHFGDPELFRALDAELDGGTMTLHEVIRREFEAVRAPREEVVAWTVEHTRLRPGLRELLALAREREWRLVVLSSGFHELIEPVLEAHGLAEVELVANHVSPGPDGWRASFRDEEPCAVCGEPCKRATLAQVVGDADATVAYVGDGYSDRCAAEAADLRFARAALARWLEARGVAHSTYEDFFQVANTILTVSP